MQFALKLLINRDYAFLWAARTVSNLGDWVFVTSVTLWIATGIAGGQSWAPLAVGGAGIAVAVPTVSIGPLAGVFVDRWDAYRRLGRLRSGQHAEAHGRALGRGRASAAVTAPVQL